MGCQEYIWSAVTHAKTPEASTPANGAATAAAPTAVPPLTLSADEKLASPAQQPQGGGFDCHGYVWSFVKNKTPLSSPSTSKTASAMPSLHSTPMTSPMVFPTSPAAPPTPGDAGALLLPLAQMSA